MADSEAYRELKKYNFPDDLKKLDYGELEHIASYVRKYIIEVVSHNGGHLAPSLGVVELTIALLRCYDVKKDNIIWDVGHQSYAYKILTDRLDSFSSLRLFGGISGFTKPSESPYDKCISGHASTSVSSALGIAVGSSLQGKNTKTVAVIGDGAMGGGIAFEGLNNLGAKNQNVTIILNDNEMSISHNVGAFAGYLSKTLTGEFIMKIKKDIRDIFKEAPLGDKILSFAKKVESSAIGFFTPGSFFEDLGIKYIGPVNGHRIRDIEKAISNSLLQEGPVLIHVVTVKGKGYKPAEEHPEIFHGVSSFDASTGIQSKKNTASWTDIFGKKIVELANRDKRVAAITAAMKDGTGLSEFCKKFPDRFFDVGIAEQHGAAFAAGLAISGMRPYFAVYSTFLQRAFDQIIHDIAIAKLPVVLCIDRAGIVGADGATHHGAFDISYLRLIPNISIMLPKDNRELNEMLDMTLSFDFPSAIRYPRGKASFYSDIPYCPIVFGKPEFIFNGSDIAIISIGHIFDESYKLYNMLEERGISTSLINLRFLRPLDTDYLKSELINKKLIVVMEEGTSKGGAGDEIQSVVFSYCLNIPVIKFALPDNFIEHGSTEELRVMAGIDAQSVFMKTVDFYEKSTHGCSSC